MRTLVRVAIGLLAARSAYAGPTDAFAPALVLDENHVAAQVTLEANLAAGQTWSPTSIAPDLWYGVTHELTIGVISSDANMDRVPPFFEPGDSICIARDHALPGFAASCRRRYHGSGLDGLYELVRGDVEVAARARVVLRDLGPAKPAVTLGAMVRWDDHWFSASADPYLQLGLANTNVGNRAELWLPITLAAQLSRVSLELHTGYNSDTSVLNDGYYVPLLVRLRGALPQGFEVGAGVGFVSLLGPQNNPRERIIEFDLAWRN